MTRHSLATISVLALLLVLPGCNGGSSGPFQATYVETLTKPEVVIKNDTDLEITVALTGPSATTLKVPPRGSETVSLTPGTYQYHASAPNVAPAKGNTAFEDKHRYTWRFWLQSQKR